MKAGVIPKLSAQWWRDNKPKTMKSTGLAPALEKYEKALVKFTNAAKDSAFPVTQIAYDKVIALLDQDVSTAVELGIKASGLHKDTKDALQKYKTQVIPQARKTIQATFSGAEKDYAVQARDMLKAFKSAAKKLVEAISIVNQQYVVLAGFADKLTEYLAGSLKLEAPDAQAQAMKANQHAHEVKNAVSAMVDKVLSETRESVSVYKESMFLNGSKIQDEFKKQLADFKDHCDHLEGKWITTDRLIVVICKNMFDRVMKRVTGTEEAENKILSKLDDILRIVHPKCEELEGLAAEVNARNMQGIKMGIKLGEFRSEEAKINTQIDKLKQLGVVGEALIEGLKPLHELKKEILGNASEYATAINNFYMETVTMTSQGKDLSVLITAKLDSFPKIPDDFVSEKKFKQREKLFGDYDQRRKRADLKIQKSQKEAEERLAFFKEKLFKKK